MKCTLLQAGRVSASYSRSSATASSSSHCWTLMEVLGQVNRKAGISPTITLVERIALIGLNRPKRVRRTHVRTGCRGRASPRNDHRLASLFFGRTTRRAFQVSTAPGPAQAGGGRHCPLSPMQRPLPANCPLSNVHDHRAVACLERRGTREAEIYPPPGRARCLSTARRDRRQAATSDCAGN
jgi:hypothetical protein